MSESSHTSPVSFEDEKSLTTLPYYGDPNNDDNKEDEPPDLESSSKQQLELLDSLSQQLIESNNKNYVAKEYESFQQLELELKQLSIEKIDQITHRELAVINSQNGDTQLCLQTSPTTNLLTKAKKGRQQAEKDAELLANRIAHLKQEEARAKQEIAKAAARTRQLVRKRQEHEKRTKEKEEILKSKTEAEQRAQAEHEKQRKKELKKRAAMKEKLMITRQLEVQRKRKSLEQREIENKMIKDSENKKTLKRTTDMRVERSQCKHKLEAQKELRVKEAKQNYDSKVQNEEILRSRTEALVAKLAQEEMELIMRLKNIQVVQASTYNELEEVQSARDRKPRNPKTKGQQPERKMLECP